MNSSHDQDDFQFKPLTEGLGFHKRAEKKADKIADRKSFLDLDMTMDLTSPLPRKDSLRKNTEAKLPEVPTNSTVDEIIKTLNQKKNLEFKEESTLTQKPLETFKTTRIDISASLLDAMLVTAGSLFCLIVLLLVTNIDLFANLYHPDSQGLIYLSLLSLVAGVSWIYMVANRVFLGFTPGEWVFDQRLGRPEEMRSSAMYAAKTALRTTAIIATGYILFPILSLLFNRDLLGRLMGLELVKKATI